MRFETIIGRKQKRFQHTLILGLAAITMVLGTSASAMAGEILLVNGFDTSNDNAYSTFAYSPDGSGGFSASGRTVLTSQAPYNGLLVQGPQGQSVPYLWETDTTGGFSRYTLSGTLQLHFDGNRDHSVFAIDFIDKTGQAVEDPAGNFYAHQGGTNRLLKISPDGTVSLIANGQAVGMAWGPDGLLYMADDSGFIHRYSTSGTEHPAFGTWDVSDYQPTVLGFDSHGNLFGLVSQTKIVKWSADGTYQGVFASGLPNNIYSTFGVRNSFAIDGNDNIFFLQAWGSLYKISPTGTVTLFDNTNDMFMSSVAVINDGVTPEPSTGLLLLGGGCILAVARRRSRSS